MTFRSFVAVIAIGVIGFGITGEGVAQDPINVLVWDEQQPKQKRAYQNFLGNAIAEHLQEIPGLLVRSTHIDEPMQGLAGLDSIDVLIWWGHVRHGEITPETGQMIVNLVKQNKLALLSLHSAHFSTPFMEAMAERTRMDVARDYPGVPATNITFLPYERKGPAFDAIREPWVRPHKYPDGTVKLEVQLPNVCFPAWREDGKPSYMTTLLPNHPMAEGIPANWKIAESEMYAEPFHVPEPDAVVFEERWETGEWFRSGAVWELGLGKVVYFRPGHESYPVFREELPLKVVENTTLWLGSLVQH